MESEKNAETLNEGFLESKLSKNEIFCSEICEDGNPGSLSSFSEKSVVDDYSGGDGITNVELERLFGDGSFVETMFFDDIAGNNGMNEVSVNDYSHEKLTVSTPGYDLCSNDFPVLEGELKISGNDGEQTAKFEEPVGKFDDILNCDEPLHDEKIGVPMEKCNDVLHPHDPGSPTKLEVSGNSINLFVEVFGPLDGISGSIDNLDLDRPVDCKSEEINIKQESSLEEKGTLSTGVTDMRAKCEGEGSIDEEGRTFDCGDLVWLKTRNNSWWPGMVTGSYNVLNDSYLVKYLGSGHILWCVKEDLKPFREYLEQMSKQNNSRRFFNSIDIALCEIGQRVKLKMTCPCFSKDSEPLDAPLFVRNKEENSMSEQEVSKFDGLSLSQFEPATFIADIRDLARSMHVPDKVDFMILKNRLSPFYRSIGHRELPLQLLRSGSDAAQNGQQHMGSYISDDNHNNIFGEGSNSVEVHDSKLARTRCKEKRKNHADGSVLDDKITSTAKSLDSRERKKSKYLSYPYIDVIKGQEKEDQKQRGAKKPFKEHHIISKADDINACSVDLLAELCSSALDCSYISRSKYSDSLKRFYCSFRKFGFLDVDIASKVAGDQAAAEEQIEVMVKKSKKQRANLASVKENVEGDKSSVVGNQKAKENAVRRRAKKKEQMTNSEVQVEGIRIVKESENLKVNVACGSFENADKFPRIVNLKAKENVVCGNTHIEKEKVIPVGLECMQSSFGMGANINAKASWMISFQQACSNLFKKSRKIPQKSPGLTPGAAGTNPISHTPPGIDDKNQISHTPPGLANTKLISHTPPGLADTKPISHTPPGLPDTNLISHTPPGLADLNPISHTPPGLADTNSVSHTPPELADTNPISHAPPGLADTNPISHTPPGLADTNPTSHSPPGLAGTNPISHTSPGLANTNSTSHTPPGLATTYPISPPGIAATYPITPPGIAATYPITPPGIGVTNTIPKLPDLNGNHPGFPVYHIPVGIPYANLVTPVPEQRNEGLASPTINGIHQMYFASISSSKGMPGVFPNTSLSNYGVSGSYQCLNGEFTNRPPAPTTMNTGHSPFVHHSLQMGNFLSAGPEAKKRKRKRKEKTCQVAPGIPDLNGNVFDMSPPGIPTPQGSHIPPEGEPQKKRRCRSAGGESGADPGGSLLLNFAPGCVPSKETLVATFSRFGLLKESELEVLSDDNVKIVYERSSEVRFASRSLERSHPFGESLINFKLDCFIPDPPKIKKKQNLQLQTFVPVGKFKNQTKLGEAPNIALIKQNVEMMKSTLEKAGNNISPEKKAKLENEIKAFLDKISSMEGSSL